MTPLGFEVKKLFHFISVRFKQTTPKVMEQALNWLQVQKLIFFLKRFKVIQAISLKIKIFKLWQTKHYILFSSHSFKVLIQI